MSRLAKKPLILPEKTTVTVEKGHVTVKGPLGELSRTFPTIISVTVTPEGVLFAPAAATREAKAMLGTVASHVRNMVAGVNQLYEKKLILEGVGYKADAKGTDLHLALGFSHPIVLSIPEGLNVKTEKGLVTMTGINKEVVGAFAAKVRSLKEPEPYKGKGFHYSDEIVRRKQGKKSA
jgi:large subunit ribosomal protein L6